MGIIAKRSKKPDTGDERVRYYHSKYVNYSKAIAVMWGVLVVCLLIIVLVCLIQPTWLGAQRDAPGQGYFGLWRYYTVRENQISQVGSFLDMDLIPSSSFQAATVFVGLAVLLTIICILCFLLFFCLSAKIVFIICGWILVVTAIFILLACIIYPGGWDAAPVVALCGSSSYDSGRCFIQWTYYLAIVAIFDAIILAVLAFVLAVRHVKLLPWQEKGGKTYIIDDDRSSGVQYVQTVQPQPQPVILVDQGSVRSQPIGTLRSHKSKTSKRNFHL